MKIKIEVDGLTLEHAAELTRFLTCLNETEKAKEIISQGGTYPMHVRRPYTEETKIVNSIEEHDAFCNGSFNKEQDPAIEDKPKQTRKRAEKVEAPTIETQEDAIGDTQEETKAEAIEVIEPETVSAPTLMQIRSLVAQKAGEHKDSIKAKLVELGAQNVSTLDAKHFQTIFAFLTEL